ncbi:MAG: TIR domain-containing protein [Candidatus Thiodiazotropha sp.]
MTDVFISYSRKDLAFVEALKQRLESQQLTVWVDIDGLYAGEEFWPEVTRAIDAAAAFIFVISPHSANSHFCKKEAEWAAAGGKRIIPLCHSEPDGADLPDQVAQRQWVFFREGDETKAAMVNLLSAIKADWAEIRQQARILRRAREWQEKSQDLSLLLRGRDLGDAIDWRTRNQGKETGATELHDKYIDTSIVAAKRRRYRIVGSVALAMLTVAIVSWFGLGYWIATVNNRAVIDIEKGEAAATLSSLQQAYRICNYLGQGPAACRDLTLVLGHGYEQLARYEESIEKYSQVIETTQEIRADDDRIHDLRGNAYQSRAFSRIMHAESLPDRDARLAHYRQAEADVDRAMESYRLTMAGIAGKPFVLSQARILIGYENYEAAIERLEVAASIEGQAKIKPEIDLLYAVIHHCLGNKSTSLTYFRKFATGLGGELKGPRWNRAIAYYNGVKQRCQNTIG